MQVRRVFPALVLLAISATVSAADPGLQSFVERLLAAARAERGVPGVAALVQIDGAIAAEAAVGVRALGRPEAVTVGDRWHIGSDTKAFTATLIARLVEQGTLSFDDTLAECFPAISMQMDPAYRSVTVAQLLSHTAGLPPLTEDSELAPFRAAIASVRGVTAQRAAVARKYLTMRPASKVGDFAYSNVGYIIAGAIAEARTGTTWEDLVREQVFAPLGIANAGFGEPGARASLDQPRGHRQARDRLVPVDPSDRDSDNPPALGPAGTINITLRDWLLFAQDQLDGVHGHGRLLRAQTYRTLHTPVAGNYALGWGVRLEPDGAPAVLTHTGSNSYWFAVVRIEPPQESIILLAMNAGTEAAEAAIGDILKPLRERLKARP